MTTHPAAAPRRSNTSTKIEGRVGLSEGESVSNVEVGVDIAVESGFC
jgi:uncharacterized membrane protein